MRPQIYCCVSICMGVSVFSRETLCVTQDKLVFVRAAVHKTKSASQNHSLGKMEKEHIMIPARNSEYVWASSGQQVASVLRSVIRQAGVITLSIPVQEGLG